MEIFTRANLQAAHREDHRGYHTTAAHRKQTLQNSKMNCLELNGYALTRRREHPNQYSQFRKSNIKSMQISHLCVVSCGHRDPSTQYFNFINNNDEFFENSWLRSTSACASIVGSNTVG